MHKKILLNYCFDFLQNKQNALLNSMKDIELSLSTEARSTAGDKHDTSRAMVHLELEKKGKQLIEVEKLKPVLTQITANKKNNSVSLGSIIKTDGDYFFIAINAGKKEVEGKVYTIISFASPLAQQFKKAKIGEQVTFMRNDFKILEIF